MKEKLLPLLEGVLLLELDFPVDARQKEIARLRLVPNFDKQIQEVFKDYSRNKMNNLKKL